MKMLKWKNLRDYVLIVEDGQTICIVTNVFR